MNSRLKSLMLMSAAMLLADPLGRGHSGYTQTKTYEDLNYTRKCMMPGCGKNRNGNKLYCSAECCKNHKLKKK